MSQYILSNAALDEDERAKSASSKLSFADLLEAARLRAEEAELRAQEMEENAAELRKETADRQLKVLDEAQPKSWKGMTGKERAAWVLTEVLPKMLTTYASRAPSETASRYISDMAALRQTYKDRRAAMLAERAEAELGLHETRARESRREAIDARGDLEQRTYDAAKMGLEEQSRSEAATLEFERNLFRDTVRDDRAMVRLQMSNAAAMSRLMTSNSLQVDRSALAAAQSRANAFAASATKFGIDPAVAFGLSFRATMGDQLDAQEKVVYNGILEQFAQDTQNRQAAETLGVLARPVVAAPPSTQLPDQPTYATPEDKARAFAALGGKVPEGAVGALTGKGGAALDKGAVLAAVDAELAENPGVTDEEILSAVQAEGADETVLAEVRARLSGRRKGSTGGRAVSRPRMMDTQ